jgi:hypothetical protein
MRSLLQIHIFANEKSVEGYHCAQAFFGMTFKMLENLDSIVPTYEQMLTIIKFASFKFVAGMK